MPLFSMTRLMAIGAVAALALAGCTAAEPEPLSAASSVPSAAPIEPSGDEVLRVGTLLPARGQLSSVRVAAAAGVEVAVREINQQGGVFGHPVEVLHRNSGDGEPAVMATALADLIERGVDVVVGPPSAALVEALRADPESEKVTIITFSAEGSDEELAAGWEISDDFAARLKMADPAVSDTRFGAEAYQATMLAALAAIARGDVGARSIAAGLPEITGDGVPCSSFGQCSDSLAGQLTVSVSLEGQRSEFASESKPAAGFFLLV